MTDDSDNRFVPEEEDDVSDEEPISFATSIGDFVGYPGEPYLEFLLFRPGHEETMRELRARKEAGETFEAGEYWQRVRNYGVLMLALHKEGFTAELYLDRSLVDPNEVDEIVDVTGTLLEQIALGTEGGCLTVAWTEEIATYDFSLVEEENDNEQDDEKED